MKHKTMLFVLAVLMLVMGVATTSAQDEKLTIGLVQIGTDNPFWIAQVAGGEEAARRYNFDLIVTSGEADLAKQVTALEDLVNQGVDAIAVNPIDANAFGPSMQKAADAGIPVVCLFSKIEGCVTTLGIEERANGRMVGDYAVKLLTEKNGEPRGKVAILLGSLGQVEINTNRPGGFRDALAGYPNIEIVAEEATDWQADRAVAITQNWLTAYPDLDLIYGLSDSLTLPAANVLERAGKSDILLVSYDGTELGLAGVADGTLKNTVALLPQYNGFWNVYATYLVASGVHLPETLNAPGAMVTSENLKGFQELSTDLADNIMSFPFELPMPTIVNDYGTRFPAGA